MPSPWGGLGVLSKAKLVTAFRPISGIGTATDLIENAMVDDLMTSNGPYILIFKSLAVRIESADFCAICKFCYLSKGGGHGGSCSVVTPLLYYPQGKRSSTINTFSKQSRSREVLTAHRQTRYS